VDDLQEWENSYRKRHMNWESQQNKPCICCHYKKSRKILKIWQNKEKIMMAEQGKKIKEQEEKIGQLIETLGEEKRK
jgi:tRNA pseudouridine-54 N-methylase